MQPPTTTTSRSLSAFASTFQPKFNFNATPPITEQSTFHSAPGPTSGVTFSFTAPVSTTSSGFFKSSLPTGQNIFAKLTSSDSQPTQDVNLFSSKPAFMQSQSKGIQFGTLKPEVNTSSGPMAAGSLLPSSVQRPTTEMTVSTPSELFRQRNLPFQKPQNDAVEMFIKSAFDATNTTGFSFTSSLKDTKTEGIKSSSLQLTGAASNFSFKPEARDPKIKFEKTVEKGSESTGASSFSFSSSLKETKSDASEVSSVESIASRVRFKPDNRASLKTNKDTKKDIEQNSSDIIPRLTSIVCKGLDPTINKKELLLNHFTKFGKVQKVSCSRKNQQAIIQFHTHAGAETAKKHGTRISPYFNHVPIFWCHSSSSSKVDERERKKPNISKISDVDSELQAMMAGSEDHKILDRPKKELLQPAAPSLPKIEARSRKPPLRIQNVNKKKASTKPRENNPARENLQRTAMTPEDRYAVLEARDKLFRQNVKKQSDLATAKHFLGTCEDMCPEKERYGRFTKKCLSLLEQNVGDSNILNHQLIIKEYSRSSADQEEPLPHELRPVSSLSLTMDYLLCNMMDKRTNVSTEEWYDFIWNRTRAIRKDITQQRLRNITCVEIVEKCARFHIHCAAALCEEDRAVFDAKINDENLTKCLQTLKHLYQDLATEHVNCSNEPEFRAYDILLSLAEGDTLRHVQKLDETVRNTAEVQFAVCAAFAFTSNNYARFFKLVSEANYLNACILHRYFNKVRMQAIHVILKAFCAPSRPEQYPVQNLCNVLRFNSVNDTIEFCQMMGFRVEEQFILLERLAFSAPTSPMMPTMSSIVGSKMDKPLSEIINQAPLPENPLKTYSPHDSFDSEGCLKKDSMLDKLLINELPLKQSVKDMVPFQATKPVCPLPSTATDNNSASPPFQKFSFTAPASVPMKFRAAAPLQKSSFTIPVSSPSEIHMDVPLQKSSFTIPVSSPGEIHVDVPLQKPYFAVPTSTPGEIHRTVPFQISSFAAPASAPGELRRAIPFQQSSFKLPHAVSTEVSSNVASQFTTLRDSVPRVSKYSTQMPLQKSSFRMPITQGARASAQSDMRRYQMIPAPTRPIRRFSEIHVQRLYEHIKYIALKNCLHTISENVIQEEEYLKIQHEQRELAALEAKKKRIEAELQCIKAEEERTQAAEMISTNVIKETTTQLIKSYLREEVLLARLQQIRNFSVTFSANFLYEFVEDFLSSVVKDVYDEEKKVWLTELDNAKQKILLQRAKIAFNVWRRTSKKRRKLETCRNQFPSCPPPLGKTTHAKAINNLAVGLSEQLRANRILDASLLYETLKEELGWLPFDLGPSFEKNIWSGTKFPKLATKTHFWKLLLIHEEDGESTAFSMFVKWLHAKFTKGFVKQDVLHGTYTCSLYWLTNAIGGRIAICVRSIVIGQEFKETVNHLKENYLMNGACAVFLCLRNKDLEMPMLCSNLSQLLKAKPSIPPIPLHCFVVGDETAAPPTVQRCLDQLVQLRILQQYQFTIVNFDVHSYNLSKVVFNAFEDLLSCQPTFPDINIEDINDFVQNGIISAFNAVYLDLNHLSTRTSIVQDPRCIIAYYNAVIKLRASVVTSDSFKKLSWPIPEVISATGIGKNCMLENVKENQLEVVRALEAVMLPPFEYDPRDTESVHLYLQLVINKFKKDPSILLSSIEHFLRKNQSYKSLSIPWADIIHECAQHAVLCQNFSEHAQSDRLEVLYIKEDLDLLNISEEWQHIQSGFAPLLKRKSPERLDTEVCTPKRKKPAQNIPCVIFPVKESVSHPILHQFEEKLQTEKEESDAFLTKLRQNVSLEISPETLEMSQCPLMEASNLSRTVHDFVDSGTDVLTIMSNLKEKLERERKANATFETNLRGLLL